MTLLQKSTNRILSKRCDRPWNWIYLPYGTRRLYKARELPFRWTHHWLFNILGAQFFFRILHNTWIFMELTSCHFIKFLLSNEVRKLTARFQISIGYAKYLAICFCNIKRSGDHLFLWLHFQPNIYSSNAVNLIFHVQTFQIESQHQKRKIAESPPHRYYRYYISYI